MAKSEDHAVPARFGFILEEREKSWQPRLGRRTKPAKGISGSADHHAVFPLKDLGQRRYCIFRIRCERNKRIGGGPSSIRIGVFQRLHQRRHRALGLALDSAKSSRSRSTTGFVLVFQEGDK